MFQAQTAGLLRVDAAVEMRNEREAKDDVWDLVGGSVPRARETEARAATRARVQARIRSFLTWIAGLNACSRSLQRSPLCPRSSFVTVQPTFRGHLAC